MNTGKDARTWTFDQLPISPMQFSDEVDALVVAAKALFANRHPGVQGAALAELLGTFVLGHVPPAREEILRLTVDSARMYMRQPGHDPFKGPPHGR